MFRRWLSEFIRNNKDKIKKVIKLFGLLILIGFGAMLAFKTENNSTKEKSQNTIYNPTKPVIEGKSVEQEEFKQEEKLINSFVEYCNNNEIQEAYNLLTDECKTKMYPNLEAFKKKYCNVIFTQNKECNLQSWVTSKNYNTYKATFMEDIMTTGNYENVKKFEDYITIVTKNEEQKININGYIKTEEIGTISKTENLEINVKSADIYMNNVRYFLEITNLSENDILLDTLNDETIKLIGTNDAEYALDESNLFSSNLVIYRNSKNRKVELNFTKQYGSGVKGKSIEFRKVITNYEKYLKDQTNYNEYKKLSIKL